MSEQAIGSVHWHVASGLAGYGPDGADGFASFDSLADAIEYAREEIGPFVDMAHESAHSLAESSDFEGAWREIERIEDLELWQASMDPARKEAPLYRGNEEAYAALLADHAAQFPRDVSYNTRLYLWDCAESDCEHCEEES